MIRNRHISVANPTDSRSCSLENTIGNGSDENDAFGALSGDENSKEKYVAKCCNQYRRRYLCRSITVTASFLLVFFCIHRLVLFSTVHQVILEEVDNPRYATNTSSVPKRNNSTNTSSIRVPKSGTNDRYKIRKTTYSLPTDPSDYSIIEIMVQSSIGRDKKWYDACAFDNATSWTNRMRKGGGDLGRFFHRACPNNGIHSSIHWNPFQNHQFNCSATSRINLEISRDHFWDDWQIQSLDASGAPKTIGGDNYYIVYSEYLEDDGRLLPVAVAIPTDHNNGIYGLEFVSVPFLNHFATNTSIHRGDGTQKMGRLTIHALSTCFIGVLDPPLKDGWKMGGSTNFTWTIENITRPYRIQDWYQDRYLRNMYGGRWGPNRKARNSLSGFDRVVFVGDSIITQMIWAGNNHHAIVSEKIKSGKIWVAPFDEKGRPPPIHVPLSNLTLQLFWEGLFLSAFRVGLNDNSIDDKALVLGSAALDIIWPAEWQGPKFENHLSTIESLLKYLRTNYPEVTLVWKLPYAQHMHQADHEHCFGIPDTCPDCDFCVQAHRYATNDRFETLYRAQKTLIETKFAKDDMVQLIDLYEVSYLAGSYFMLPGDSIHYRPEFNSAVLEKLLYAEHDKSFYADELGKHF